MYRAGAFLFVLLFGFTLLYAQEEESPPDGGGDWDFYAPDTYTHGDQTFIISLGTIFPTVFYNNGKSMTSNFYAILVGARTGYQFYFWRFEFPLNLTIGMVWHTYLNFRYYGLYLKGGGAAYFRFNSEWSFGVSTNWYWLPQWTNERSKNVDGNMLDVLLSARYHF